MDPGIGLFCNLTGRKPAFDRKCENYQGDSGTGRLDNGASSKIRFAKEDTRTVRLEKKISSKNSGSKISLWHIAIGIFIIFRILLKIAKYANR